MQTPLVFVALVGLSIVACVAGLLIGQGDLGDPRLRDTLLDLRLSRVGVAFLAGAAHAVGGVLVQGFFRNPLASPSILGTTAGASLGGQIALLVFNLFLASRLTAYIVPEMFLSIGCVVGAVVSLMLLMAITGRRRDLIFLLLTGFILSSLFLSFGSFVLALAQDSWELSRAVVAFSFGGVSGSGPRQVAFALPMVISGVIVAFTLSKRLDLLLSGEDEAQSLGVNVEEVRFLCIVWTAVLTAGAVSVGGNVGFVGLVVPHALRPIVGVEHRLLVPASALAGGGFLVCCDIVSRLPEREIPLGVVTGLIGAPVFLVLLVRAHRRGTYG
ncbi:MAG TPA: iron ABC transporter permease [Kofleriaceae bacterium]|nr:iron ABC transporter permease [Kofleriaceae bacterium]